MNLEGFVLVTNVFLLFSTSSYTKILSLVPLFEQSYIHFTHSGVWSFFVVIFFFKVTEQFWTLLICLMCKATGSIWHEKVIWAIDPGGQMGLCRQDNKNKQRPCPCVCHAIIDLTFPEIYILRIKWQHTSKMIKKIVSYICMKVPCPTEADYSCNWSLFFPIWNIYPR